MALKNSVVDILNGSLWRVGAQIRSAPSLSALPALFYRYFHDDFFFVQIGANDGQRADPINKLVKRHKLKGLAVEPLGDMFKALKKTYAANPHVRLRNVAIHRTESEITLYRVRPDADVPYWAHGIASSDPKHYERSGSITAEDMIAERVRACSLAQLLEENDVKHIDLFLVDTEGYDAEIISMLLETRYRPSIIAFEHNMQSGVMAPETFWQLGKRLMDEGYFLVTEEFDAVAYRPAKD